MVCLHWYAWFETLIIEVVTDYNIRVFEWHVKYSMKDYIYR